MEYIYIVFRILTTARLGLSNTNLNLFFLNDALARFMPDKGCDWPKKGL